ncbi:MAG: hypothetical protein Q7R53_00540 [bacterium]|nr:hypothetical protein [bacterium]
MAEHIPFKVNMEHPEQVDACIVWCFDPRMQDVFRHFVKEMGYRYFDSIMIAGGAKDLSFSSLQDSRNDLLSQIQKSISLHNPKVIALMVHSDCGAFGYLKAFDNDLEKERLEMEKVLREAKQFLEENVEGDQTILLVFIDGKGIHII